MQEASDVAGFRSKLEEEPVFVVLDSIYSRNEESPVGRDKSTAQKYAELARKVREVLYEKLQVENAEGVRDLPFSTLFSIAEMVILSVSKTPEIFVEVMNPEYPGDFLSYHSLNVAFMACKVGMGLNFEYKNLTELCVAALLHDIGMTKIDADCYVHEQGLSEQQRNSVESHPKLGWQFFKRLKEDFPWLLRVVLEEHQREHGQGYPSQVQTELHPYSKIIGLVDSFEALSHKRIFRKAFHPADAMKAIIDAKEFLFAKDVLKGFIEALAIYPVGSLVQLNNKRMAQVVLAVYGKPLRPAVRMLEESEGVLVQTSEMVDLSKEHNLYVTGLAYNELYQAPENLRVS